jgi:hypothetical protein
MNDISHKNACHVDEQERIWLYVILLYVLYVFYYMYVMLNKMFDAKRSILSDYFDHF